MLYKSAEEVYDKIQSTSQNTTVLAFYFALKTPGTYLLELRQQVLDLSNKQLSLSKIKDIMLQKDFAHWCITDSDTSAAEKDLITEWYTNWSQK